MQRVISDENKENPGKCICNVNKLKLYQSDARQSKVLADRLKPRIVNNVIKDNKSQSNKLCLCRPRIRSKSSNDDIPRKQDKTAAASTSYQRRRAAESTNIQTQRPVVIKRSIEKYKVPLSYGDKVRKEINDILHSQQPTTRNTDLNICCQNQSRPIIFVSPSHFSVYNDSNHSKHEVANSDQRNTAKQKPVRRHSSSTCSSAVESTLYFTCLEQVTTRNIYSSSEICVLNGSSRSNCLPQYKSSSENLPSNCVQQNYLEPVLKIRSGECMLSKHITIFPTVRKNYHFFGSSSEPDVECRSLTEPHSPILPNRYIDENILINKKSQRLRQPKVKRRTNATNYQTINAAFVGDIYNTEYLEDIFMNIKKQQMEITLEVGFLQKYNPNSIFRAEILNWILKSQTYLHFSESEYYLTVNIMDHVLASITLPVNMYQLVAVSALWIAMKLIGSCNYKASTIITLCDNTYWTEHLLKMEQKIMKIMNFKIHTTEPSICVNYYLKLFNLENNTLTRFSALYALDFLSFLPEFSSTPTSLIAAAAVNFVLSIINKSSQIKFYRVFMEIFSREEIENIKKLEVVLHIQMKNMTDENYMFREPYNKYNSKKLMYISKYFSDLTT